MTGPAAGDTARQTSLSAVVAEALGGLGPLLALAFVLRVALVVGNPGSGFGVDLDAFRFWATDLAENGPFGFYGRGFFADYTPGYLYLLWLVGSVGDLLGGIGDLIKVPALLADLAVAWLVRSVALELGASRRRALVAAAVFLFFPASWFDSAVWGQVDSVGVVFLLLGVREIVRGRAVHAAIWATVAAVVKPQLGILVPVLAAWVVGRLLDERRRAAEATTAIDGAVTTSDVGGPTASRTARWTSVRATLLPGLAAVATASLLAAPFGLTFLGLLRQVGSAAGGYPYLSVNAYNPWALLSLDGHGIAADGTWVLDVPVDGGAFFAFGPIPALFVGTFLLLVAIAWVARVVIRRPTALTAVTALAVLALVFFVVPTRVHERYLYPFIPLGLILAAGARRWWLPWFAAATATTLGMYVVLTTLYPDNPGIEDWLGIGPSIRSSFGVATIALVHLAVLVWGFLRLRDRALDEGVDPIPVATSSTGVSPGVAGATGGPPPPLAGAAAAPSDMVGGSPIAGVAIARIAAAARSLLERPDPTDPGIGAAIRRGLLVRSHRADRSASLAREGGGRLGRLDVWLLVVLAVSILSVRLYRLEEPYGMHFDEVYHARTATEFLQHWRYGDPHSIYEFTHPHLAKYAMAGGLIAWGNDRVTGTSELGVPVRAAALEPRREDERLPAGRGGDRLHVVTGSELRVLDLAQRRLVATIPIAGADAVAVAPSGRFVYVAAAGGRILELDTASLDGIRLGAAPPDASALREVTTLDGAVTALHVAADGLHLAAVIGSDLVVTLAVDTGETTGRIPLERIGGMAAVRSADTIVAVPDAISDSAFVADELARILGDSTARYRDLLATGSEVVVIGIVPDADARSALDEAIADGRLAGVEIRSLGRLAVATGGGIALISPALGTVVETVATETPTTGLATSTDLDDEYVYAAAGDEVVVATIPEAGGSAAEKTRIRMPGPVTDVRWNPASRMVHVLGARSDGTTTVYVIEPHANTVYADAPLDIEPAAWVADVAPLDPDTDRQELLAISGAGTVAAIDVGSHAFAWRLPGVLAGVLTALLLFLLARILFSRREIAVLAGLFAGLDGMLFVQSRIAMNDAYVGLFIVAAYTIFAGLWTGAWRRRAWFWLLMPVVGLLLGLALASKWVALYAIGGLAVLVLARSALGRFVLVGGLIGLTAVLGYLGLNVPEDATNGGNLTFVLVMIAITLVATAIVVRRPVAWTLEEVRFAVAAPFAAGVAILLVGIPLGFVGGTCAPDASTCSSRLLLQVAFLLVATGAVAAAAFRLLARLGWGPLAVRPPSPEAVALVPEPAPEGWLRLGSGFGIPAVWLVVSLVAIPLAVYVATYLPWVALGNRLTEAWPAGNAGQTLAELTASMYRYHNDLRATHAASSPWWAWPFDLKPVWFYQGSFAGGTSGAIYDAGNLALWWLAIPAMAFASWQAYRRRSLALTLVVVAFLCQWLPWARIDRATFQYHYYTSLPFVLLALAYFVAELRHGPSRATWLLARVAAALAVLGPALLWLVRLPLCAWVGVERVYANSEACVVFPPGQIVLTTRTAGLVLVLVLAGVAIVRGVVRLERGGGNLAPLLATAAGAAFGLVLAGRLPDDAVLFRIDGFPPEVVAIGLLVPLLPLAWYVATARDPRRFAAGIVFVAIGWFVLWYPNLSALPLPTPFFNAYQGFLPTYLYPFQFPVNTDPPVAATSFLSAEFILLIVGLIAATASVAYGVVSRLSAGTSRAREGAPEGPLP